MVIYQYGFAIIFLALSAVIEAKAGGSTQRKAVIKICFWGTAAMLMTALVGYLYWGKNDLVFKRVKSITFCHGFQFHLWRRHFL